MFRILSIDGGGIRGIIPARWLQHIERELGMPLRESFDLVAGSSTGSILAAGIAAGISTDALVDLYQKQGGRIFPPRPRDRSGWSTPIEDFLRPKYDPEPLAEILRSHFCTQAQALIMSDLTVDCMIVAYNAMNRSLRTFRSWDPTDKSIAIWEACKASCSAPTYFPAHVMKLDGAEFPLIDGGVAANNPSSLALAEAFARDPSRERRDILLVSLGTGNLLRPITIAESQKWGGARWVLPMIDVVLDGSSLASHHVCQALLRDRGTYYRLQVDLRAANEDLDDSSAENINELLADALRYIEETAGRSYLSKLVATLRQSAGAAAAQAGPSVP